LINPLINHTIQPKNVKRFPRAELPYNQNLIKGLTHPGLFHCPVDATRLLSKGIGWLTWTQLRKILEITKGHFRTEAERKFVEDLIVYLDYKIREGERIRNERKQLSFW
jgi:hypothetical protein